MLPGKVTTTATMTTTMLDATTMEVIVAVTSILPTAPLANAWIPTSTVVSTLTTILLVITGQD